MPDLNILGLYDDEDDELVLETDDNGLEGVGVEDLRRSMDDDLPDSLSLDDLTMSSSLVVEELRLSWDMREATVTSLSFSTGSLSLM